MASARQMRNVPISKSADVRTIVRKMIKSHDVATRELKPGVLPFNGTMATAGAIYPLTQFIVPGDTVAQREGSEIIVEKIIVRLSISFPVTTVTVAGDVVRVILFRDMQSQGVLPTVGQVLDTAVPTSGFQTLYSQSKRFKIIDDSLIAMCAVAENRNITKVMSHKQNGKVFYYGTTDANSALGAGQYYLLLICGVNQSSLFVANAEVHYLD